MPFFNEKIDSNLKGTLKTQRFTIFEKGCNGQNIHQSNTLGHDSLTVLQCVKHFEVVEYWHNLMPSSSSVRHC